MDNTQREILHYVLLTIILMLSFTYLNVNIIVKGIAIFFILFFVDKLLHGVLKIR